MGGHEKMGMARIPTPICIECGKGGTILVQMSDYLLWQSKNRPLIQNCFPALSREQREQILTGIHPECWEKMFPPEEEEVEIVEVTGTLEEAYDFFAKIQEEARQ